MLTDKLNFFIGYDSKEDIAYRVCKFSILNNTKSKITTGELYNDLIDKCTGDIIYFIHPNIIYDKNYIHEMNNEMIKNKVDFIVNDK